MGLGDFGAGARDQRIPDARLTLAAGTNDPGVKNGDERLVVLNNVAKSIIEQQRGLSKEWVFPYNGTAMHRMNDSAGRRRG